MTTAAFNRLPLLASKPFDTEAKARKWCQTTEARLRKKGHRPRYRRTVAKVRAHGVTFTMHVVVFRDGKA